MPAAIGAWHYDCTPRSRKTLAVAAMISAVVHASVFFGVKRTPVPAAVARVDDHLLALNLVIPEAQELVEIDPLPGDDSASTADFGVAIPLQADLPSTPQPKDFVQQLDFASLVERPDLSAAKMFAIPANIRRGKINEGIGDIFDLVDLDRIPEAIFQPSPIFPPAMKQETSSATVTVEFVVDTSGRVVSAFVTESSHHGFELAAIHGVTRWKFRPGLRGGRKVNTRMRVPIRFKLAPRDV